MSKMVPITSPDLILSSCMEPGHREPLDQLFKRWLDLLFYPLPLVMEFIKASEVVITVHQARSHDEFRSPDLNFTVWSPTALSS